MNISALLECLHLEALGVHVLLRDSLVTLGGINKLLTLFTLPHTSCQGL